MSRTPIALSPTLPSELLTYILTHRTCSTTLIICQPRSTFLSSLPHDIQQISPQSSPPPPQESTSEPPLELILSPPRHPLLIPTLHQLATSRHINLVFITTVSHLRAYLAIFPPPPPKQEKDPPPKQSFDKQGKKTPLLVIYGIVELHRDTSEWSAQGLGNSLAALVEAGYRSGRRSVLVEERKMDDGVVELEEGLTGLEEGKVEGEPRKVLRKCWQERVPMLNGSVRRVGLESEDGGWSGRTVEVGRILGRWFRFKTGEWELNVDA